MYFLLQDSDVLDDFVVLPSDAGTNTRVPIVDPVS